MNSLAGVWHINFSCLYRTGVFEAFLVQTVFCASLFHVFAHGLAEIRIFTFMPRIKVLSDLFYLTVTIWSPLSRGSDVLQFETLPQCSVGFDRAYVKILLYFRPCDATLRRDNNLLYRSEMVYCFNRSSRRIESIES